jgi:hypothetical protein
MGRPKTAGLEALPLPKCPAAAANAGRGSERIDANALVVHCRQHLMNGGRVAAFSSRSIKIRKVESPRASAGSRHLVRRSRGR